MQNTLFSQKNKNFSINELEFEGKNTQSVCFNKQFGARSFIVLLTMAVLALLASLSIFVASPQSAYAKSFDMPNVTIDATVQPNGDLKVVEQRTFSFDGTYSAIWWEFDNLPTYASLKVDSVSINKNGTTQNLPAVSFVLDWRKSGGPSYASYSVDSPKNTAYVFFSAVDEEVTVTMHYTLTDVVALYQDTAELNWQVIGSGWAGDSQNVTVNLALPVPAGSSNVTADGNVRAWGHGPLNSSISLKNDGTVSYTVPSVASGKYAEARVVFPTSWMSEMKATDANAFPTQSKLDSILSEEQQWADQTNQMRTTALIALIVAILISVLALVWALWSFVRYGKELKPQFTDEYWRDVPVKGEHPAVIGRLCRFDKEEPSDFTATILHLVNEGALLVNKGTYKVKRKTVEDYYLTRVDSYEPHDEIDRKALSLLFDDIAGGEDALWLTSIKEYAKNNPKKFSEGMQTWQGLVTAKTMQGEYFEAYSKSKKFKTAGVAAVVVIACIVIAFFTESIFPAIPGVISGIAVGVISHYMSRRTQKGADAYARCMALKKWLTEFSALNERPVLDVKVWGEFMVYALIFGVAKKAIKEMREAVPELFSEDEQMMANSSFFVPWWLLYTSPHGFNSGLVDFSSAFDTAVVSSFEAISSGVGGNFSSGGGFGGGFSIGGGGGFGGGGGAR